MRISIFRDLTVMLLALIFLGAYSIPSVAGENSTNSCNDASHTLNGSEIGVCAADAAAKEMEAKAAALEAEIARRKAKLDAEETESSTSVKPKTITCIKGKSTKKFRSINPKCPSGYKLKS